MELRLSDAISSVRFALLETAEKSSRRRLMVYGERIPCKPGCSGCCSRLVRVTVAEAVLIHDLLQESGRWREVSTECRRQLPWLKDANPVSWLLMNRRCPVLAKDGTCSAYRLRPAACSVHHVTSDPGLCDPWNSGSGDFAPLDFDDLYEEFRGRLAESVAGRGILSLELPIQAALLLAERVNVQSGISLEKAVSLFLNEL